MADIASLKQKVTTLVDNVKYYWKEPPKGRYMSFKEIGSYAFGGIGAYLIVSMSYICMLATTNVFITGTIGITPTDMCISCTLLQLSQVFRLRDCVQQLLIIHVIKRVNIDLTY